MSEQIPVSRYNAVLDALNNPTQHSAERGYPGAITVEEIFAPMSALLTEYAAAFRLAMDKLNATIASSGTSFEQLLAAIRTPRRTKPAMKSNVHRYGR